MSEKTVGRRLGFEGRAVKVEILDVELDSGRRSVREIVRHPGAVVILPQLPDGRFVFVRQFRKAIERELLEAVAGTREPGENPDATARRELREETGYDARRLIGLGAFLPAPGYSDEVLHAYYAELAPTPSPLAPDDDETIDVVRLSEAEIEERIAAGTIDDGKTLASWLLWQRRRPAR